MKSHLPILVGHHYLVIRRCTTHQCTSIHSEESNATRSQLYKYWLACLTICDIIYYRNTTAWGQTLGRFRGWSLALEPQLMGRIPFHWRVPKPVPKKRTVMMDLQFRSHQRVHNRQQWWTLSLCLTHHLRSALTLTTRFWSITHILQSTIFGSHTPDPLSGIVFFP